MWDAYKSQLYIGISTCALLCLVNEMTLLRELTKENTIVTSTNSVETEKCKAMCRRCVSTLVSSSFTSTKFIVRKRPALVRVRFKALSVAHKIRMITVWYGRLVSRSIGLLSISYCGSGTFDFINQLHQLNRGHDYCYES